MPFLLELHLLLGIVNLIFDELQEKTIEEVNNGRLPLDIFKYCSHNFHIFHQEYRGKKLNGPAANKVLKYAEEITAYVTAPLKKYGHALKTFDIMKKACFTTTLDKDWAIKMDNFERAFKDLGIRNIPKSHICLEHVKQYISYTGKPIGAFSEQSFEGTGCPRSKFSISNSYTG